jgi:hypothetical protein
MSGICRRIEQAEKADESKKYVPEYFFHVTC